MKIAVYGQGFVGSAYAAILEDVVRVDPAKGFNDDVSAVDGVIIAVPAPTLDDGTVDTSIIDDIIAKHDQPIMIKSTIPPHYADNLPKNVTYSPEFLREVCAMEDVRHLNFMVLGGGRMAFWKDVFPWVEHIETDAYTASFMKYGINTFLATKVTFMNELYNLYEGEWDELKYLMQLDRRIGDSHMDVPGYDGKQGWAGSCFPKDVDSWLKFSDNASSVLSAVKQANTKHRS